MTMACPSVLSANGQVEAQARKDQSEEVAEQRFRIEELEEALEAEKVCTQVVVTEIHHGPNVCAVMWGC